MPRLTAVLDANVLYSAGLRDLLTRLAFRRLYRAKWTVRIHEEWIRNLLSARPDLRRGQLERTRSLMDAHAPDCLVIGYGALVADLALPDPNDRHVLAAAVRAHADHIVTYNLRDFPEVHTGPLGISAIHPDTLVSGLMAEFPVEVVETAREHRSALKTPPCSATEYIYRLERLGLARTATQLRARIDEI